MRTALSPRPPWGGGASRSSFPLVLLLQTQAPGRVPSRIEGLPGDSISLKRPPLPGGVADVVRAMFDAPQALQIGGAVVGILVLAGLVAIAWWQRAELLAWFQTRPKRSALAAAALGFAAIGVFGWFSLKSWNYMQHDNSFCSGCHVMAPAWQKFQTTRHARLQCHQCHQQSIFASARQLVLWVADRPGKIPTHSKVPNERCIACHVKGDPTRWKQIAATEGHRLHLESAKLPGLQCVRCHGFSVHQFVPTDMTCGQAGCHTDVRIRLGKMTRMTTLHCVICHRFTRVAAAPMSVRDSVRRWLTPTRTECFSCHAMQKLMVDQQLAHDPHGAVCGACHNPHKQVSAAEALRICVNCHKRPDTLTAAHRGLPAAMLSRCTACHKPHSWKTQNAGDCRACHGDIFSPGGSGRISAADLPAMPWTQVYVRLRAAMLTPDPVASFAAGRPVAAAPGAWFASFGARRAPRAAPGMRFASWSASASARWQQPQQPQQRDTPQRPNVLTPGTARAPRIAPTQEPLRLPVFARGFSHALHRGVKCTSCHSMASAHGALLIHSVEDCLRCHHSPTSGRACASCHQPNELPQGLRRTVATRTSVAPAVVNRTLPFNHRDHPGVPCTTCHSGRPHLTTIASCTTCHASHHTTVRECRVCHATNVYAAHNAVAHLTCGGGGCHQDPAVNAMSWSREVCLACHPAMVRHEVGRFCGDCHRVPALRTTAAGVRQ